METENFSNYFSEYLLGKDHEGKISRKQQNVIYSHQRSIKKLQTEEEMQYSDFVLFLKQKAIYRKKKIQKLTYKNIEFLRLFLSPCGKIYARNTTNLKAFQQRIISKLIRQARNSCLIPLSFSMFL